MDIRKQVGLNIRRIRVEKGIPQETLAADAEVDRAYMSGLERGVRNPTVALLQRIANALQVTVSELTAASLDKGAAVAPLRGGRRPSKLRRMKPK